MSKVNIILLVLFIIACIFALSLTFGLMWRNHRNEKKRH